MSKDNRSHFLLVYTHLRAGGIETLIVRMANWLSARGHRVTLLIMEPGELLALLDKAVRVEILGIKNFCFFFPCYGKRRLKEFDDRDIDVIYSYGPEGCYLASYLYKYGFRKKKPVFLNGIYHPHEFALCDGISALDRMRIDMYNTYVADGSKFFMSEQVRSGNERILGKTVPDSVIWPIPIDVSALGSADRRAVPRRVVSIGRYVRFKTYNLYMIDVIEELVRSGYDVTWEVYGYGPLEEGMKRLIRDRKLEDRIFLRGALPYDEFSRAVSVASVYVGMGTSLIEAGFCAVPCVPAIADDPKGVTYGALYKLPYYSCGERLSDDFKTVGVTDAIRRIFDMSEAEYRAEAERTFQYVQLYSIDSLMQRFLDYMETAPRGQKIDLYPGCKFAMYCLRSLYYSLRQACAFKRRLGRLIRPAENGVRWQI